MDSEKSHSVNPVKRGLRKIGSVFRRGQKDAEKVSFPTAEPEPLARDNIRASNPKNRARLTTDDADLPPSSKSPKGDDTAALPPNGDEKELPESPNQRYAKDMAKSILKHAGRSARELKVSLSRKARKSKADSAAELGSSDEESLSVSAASTPDSASGNSSFKVKDGVQIPDLSGSNSFKATTTGDTTPTGAR